MSTHTGGEEPAVKRARLEGEGALAAAAGAPQRAAAAGAMKTAAAAAGAGLDTDGLSTTKRMTGVTVCCPVVFGCMATFLGEGGDELHTHRYANA
jgi:hypothetical protein